MAAKHTRWFSYRMVGYFPYRHKFSMNGMGSLLGKIYSGLLHEVQLWVAIAEIGMDAIMSRWPIIFLKPWVSVSSKVLQSTIAAEVTRVAIGAYTASNKCPER